jgi:hypothetical protein
LVFVEGAKTENLYFTEWRGQLRDRVIVNVHEFTGVDPRALVERAVREKREEARDAKRGRGPAHDEVWCVFDVDKHARLAAALDMASANGVQTAVSNPCFELWLVLHYQDQTAFIERRPAQRLAARLLGCDKRLTPAALEALIERCDEALGRAQRLDEMHLRNGSRAGSNPSSGVWRLVERIRAASAEA